MKQEDGQIQEWMDTIDEFLIVIDENGNIVRVNQAWIDFCEECAGAENTWKAGSNYFQQLEKSSKKSELQNVKRVVNRETAEHKQTYPFLLGNGETQWLSVKVRPVKLAAENSKGAILSHKLVNLHSIQPITAESVLESMTDGFFLLDVQLKVNYLNEIGERLLHCKSEDALGRELFEVFPEAIGTVFEYEYRRALKENVTTEFESFYPPLDAWFNVNVYPLKKGGLALYFQDISERKKTEEKLIEYAYFDYLTGLPNRRKLTQKAISLKEKNEKFSVFYINLDNLKFINALHNYNTGDKVLKIAAGKLKELADEQCEIGRLDGDEFLVIRQPKKSENLEQFAKKLIGVFEQPFVLDDFQSVTVHVSIGIACYPFDTKKLGEMVSFAETAMYEAKKVRGSTYAFFRPKMKAERARKLKIEESLMGDLGANGFYFTLQPQIDGNTGKLQGVEVLSRWNHPEFGELSPLEFIEIAEQSGTIAPLTYHLQKEVFVKIKEWEKRYGWNIKTAINITPSLLTNPAFFDDFFELMEQYEIAPELVEIEITEQVELAYSEITLKNLLLCKEKGISIALDDFGTGFSMISYLTHFPINKIKVDKYFIQKIGQDVKSEAVLTSLIHLANSIECELLAEGVERSEEVAFLKKNLCTVYQGYLYDKPLKVDDFEDKYLRNRHRFSVE